MTESKDSTDTSFWPTHRPRLRSAEGWDRKVKIRKRLSKENVKEKELEKVPVRRINTNGNN
ncbi:MAG: hypothetical protein K940chlam8_00085 [Chlamydiae bacterium]|nr:hypothetical protein [Chlamydiota bacterium]